MTEWGSVPDIDPVRYPEGAWVTPLELVMALPTSSVIQSVVRDRMARQIHPHPQAVIYKRGNRFFAEVLFRSDQRLTLIFALDVYTSRPDVGAIGGRTDVRVVNGDANRFS